MYKYEMYKYRKVSLQITQHICDYISWEVLNSLEFHILGMHNNDNNFATLCFIEAEISNLQLTKDVCINNVDNTAANIIKGHIDYHRSINI